jgi:hypothetical protein
MKTWELKNTIKKILIYLVPTNVSSDKFVIGIQISDKGLKSLPRPRHFENCEDVKSFGQIVENFWSLEIANNLW